MDAVMLDRRDFVQQLLADRGDLLVVPGLGSATYDVAAAGDHPLNFYLWGAMGGTAMIALGLALARPDRRVVALPGDGDMLMGRVEARFDNLPPLFKDLGIEHVLGPVTVRARSGQLSNILFEFDTTDSELSAIAALAMIGLSVNPVTG